MLISQVCNSADPHGLGSVLALVEAYRLGRVLRFPTLTAAAGSRRRPIGRSALLGTKHRSASPRTRALYTRVAVNTIREVKSPLERLGVNLASLSPPDWTRVFARPS